MNEQINMNLSAANNILRKMKYVTEEMVNLLRDLDKQITNAEMEGWVDKNYQIFNDSYQDTRNIINTGIRRMEEEHIPFLERLIRNAENL